MFLCKGIRPRKLKIDAVRMELLNELRAEGVDSKKELKKTVQYWRGKKPKFEAIIGLTGEDASVFVGPTGSTRATLKWMWIDEGTKGPYDIPKTHGKLLRFKVGGHSGSFPNSLMVRPAVPGTKWVSTYHVSHKGIRPRNWSPLVQKRRKKKYIARMLKALKRGMEKA